MATIHQPINLRKWSQAPPTSLATSPSPNLLARSRSVHSYKPSQSLPGDTSNTRTESMYTGLVPNEPSLQGSKTEMKKYAAAAAAYAYTVMKCGCMSVHIYIYIRIYTEEYIVCWSNIYRTAGHVCILLLDRAWLTRCRCTRSIVLWAFGQLLASIIVYMGIEGECMTSQDVSYQGYISWHTTILIDLQNLQNTNLWHASCPSGAHWAAPERNAPLKDR